MSEILVKTPDGRPLTSVPSVGRRLATSYVAASRTHGDLAEFKPRNVSAQYPLTHERDQIAARVHDFARNDGWASAGVTRSLDSVIGAGWRLSSKPNARLLGIEPEAAEELAKDIEAEFADYASDPDCCDALRVNDFGAQCGVGFRHFLGDGEALGALLWRERAAPYATCLQIIDPDRLSNPYLRMDSVTMRAGVEMDKAGAPIAYHIRQAHPGDFGVIGAYPWIWERRMRGLPNGRREIIHAFETKRAGQVRGEPQLAPVVKKLHMMGRFDEAELQAAVLNAVLAVFVKSPNDHELIREAMSDHGGGIDDDVGAIKRLNDNRIEFYRARGINLGTRDARINYLWPDDEVQFSNPAHPNANFEAFFRAALRNVAAATGLSYEQLSMDYSQSNYSSTRAAMLEVWRGFARLKHLFTVMFVQPWFAAWLEEAIARGRIKLPNGAPDFRDARTAYARAKWIGPGRGWVDPEKEAKASIERLNGGISTLERECAEQGMDYIEILDQRARERREMIARGIDPDMLLRAKLPQGTQPGNDPPPPESDDGKSGTNNGPGQAPKDEARATA